MAKVIVPPEINNPNPGSILWVGRDPGMEELFRGRPFVGPAGMKLQHTMAKHGLKREDSNYANIVGFKPWNNEFYRHSAEDIEVGREDLFNLISRLEPSLIVALGNEAAYTLVPEYGDITRSTGIKSAKGISNVRGFFFQREFDGGLLVPVLVCFHPSSVLYQPSQMFQFNIDVERAAKFVRGELPRETLPDVELIRSKAQMARFKDYRLTAFDIETKWDGSALLCVAYCGDDLHPAVGYAASLGAQASYLRGKYPKLAHNGKTDCYFLGYKCGVHVGGYLHDTMNLHWAMYPELAGKRDTGAEEAGSRKKVKGRMTRKGLNFLASMYLNVPWWKSYEHNDPEKMALLCAQDVWVTKKLYDIMVPLAEEMGVMEQYRHNMKLQPVLNKVQARGIRIDEPLRRKKIKALKDRKEKRAKASMQAGLKVIKSQESDFFRVEKTCKCCGGGSIQRQHCWRCFGLPEKPKKKADYLLDKSAVSVRLHPDTEPIPVKKVTTKQLRDRMTHCLKCEASGKISRYEFNPLSSTQMGYLLYDILGAPRSKMVSGSPCGEATLKKILEEWAKVPTNRKSLASNRERARAILEPYFGAKKDNTMIGHFKRIKPGPDGKIRTELSASRVETSRLASSDSIYDKASTNLQNLPKKEAYRDPELYAVRECFIPDDNMILVMADYAKAEAFLAAAFSKDWDFFDRMIAGEDVHSWHAAIYFGHPEWKETKAPPAQRHVGKTITYASCYEASVRKIMEIVNADYDMTGIKLSLAETEKYHRIHLDLHPLERWWQEVGREIEEKGYLINPFGLKRTFMNPNPYDRRKEAVNWLCQSTVAQAINKSMIMINAAVDTDGYAELLHQVHDEIIMQVRGCEVSKVAKEVKKIMEGTFTIHGRTIYIPVEISVGDPDWWNKRGWK